MLETDDTVDDVDDDKDHHEDADVEENDERCVSYVVVQSTQLKYVEEPLQVEEYYVLAPGEADLLVRQV